MGDVKEYKRIINSTHGDTYQHRLVAEELLGRKLLVGETVHHKDSDRTNNSPENIMVFKTNGDHSRYHRFNERTILTELPDGSWTSKRPTDYLNPIECCICKTFFRPDNESKKRYTCSPKCAAVRQHKTEHPTKEELQELIWKYPTTKVSKMFGVSDKAIEKWCKKYEIDKPPRGYWMKQKTLENMAS